MTISQVRDIISRASTLATVYARQAAAGNLLEMKLTKARLLSEIGLAREQIKRLQS